MYKCLKCGAVFDEDELCEWSEERGEFWGAPCTEKMSGCPMCHGECEEVELCQVCETPCTDSELHSGVCDSCLDSYRKNFDKCYELTDGETEEVEINALVASILDPSDINQILVEYIRKNLPDADCSAFIDYDIEWFAERILEKNISEVKKNV